MDEAITLETPTGTLVLHPNGDVVSPEPHSRSVRNWAYTATDETLTVVWDEEAWCFLSVPMELVAIMVGMPSLQRFMDGVVKPNHEARRFADTLA